MPTIDIKHNKKELKNIPILNDGQIYIYVLKNSPAENIKIGKTTNLKQRIQSLSGSNSAGNEIVKCFCSPSTYLYTLETICHNKFNFARIAGTEWFDGAKITFEEAVEYLEELFADSGYKNCNEARRKAMLSNILLSVRKEEE